MGTELQAAITWLGHSTFLVETDAGARVLLEAWVDDNPVCPAEHKQLANLDLILITHGHGDHSSDAAKLAARSPEAKVAGGVELCWWLKSRLGIPEAQLIDFNKGGTIEVAGIKVTMVHAQHSSSGEDGDVPFYAGEPAGFVLELENGYRIYHAGDTNVFGDMRLIGELYPLDLAILPIGGHFTMDPREAAMAVELLGAQEVLGMHYGTFPLLAGRPAQLRELVQEGVTVHELEIGETLGRVRAGASA